MAFKIFEGKELLIRISLSANHVDEILSVSFVDEVEVI